jgi:hypothetical protein
VPPLEALKTPVKVIAPDDGKEGPSPVDPPLKLVTAVADVSKVPDVGSVTFVPPVVVSVSVDDPEVTNEPPSVMVLAPLFIPVPPLVDETGTERLIVDVEPRGVEPPPVNPVPAEIVTDVFTSDAFVILVIVFNDPLIVLLVNTCPVSVPTNAVVASGIVYTRFAVDENDNVFVTPVVDPDNPTTNCLLVSLRSSIDPIILVISPLDISVFLLFCFQTTYILKNLVLRFWTFKLGEL